MRTITCNILCHRAHVVQKKQQLHYDEILLNMLSSSLFFGLFCSTLMIQKHSKRMNNLLNVHIF